MNFTRIALASLGGFITYFLLGGLMFAVMPTLRSEFQKYPAVYRDQQGQMSHMPAGMAAMFVAIVAIAVIYALTYQSGFGALEGARFGALIGIFAIGSFVVHNHVNLNIGLRLTIGQSIAYFIEWLAVGVVMGLIYKPMH
jgi:hypothetical protein